MHNTTTLDKPAEKPGPVQVHVAPTSSAREPALAPKARHDVDKVFSSRQHAEISDVVAKETAILKLQNESTTAELHRLSTAYDDSQAANARLSIELDALRTSVMRIPLLEAYIIELQEKMRMALDRIASAGIREAIDEWESDVGTRS